MVNADRQTIIETNRSLRNIKAELETLLEKGAIDDSVFDTIHASLPQESPLSGPLRTATSNGNGNPTPARTSSNPTPSHADSNPTSPPTQAFQNLDVNPPRQSPAPPSYDDTPPPGLPARNATPAKPVIASARALYRYNASDARDCGFEKDDQIDVHEYMNQDWWMGLNKRTGQEGIFPRNYVFVESENDKRGMEQTLYPQQPTYAQPQQQAGYGYPGQSHGPPSQQNPYNSNVPPMAVAEGGQPSGHGGGKGGEMGKKFGKKLGNAAIFGAGATIGGNIVNSIF